jgi:hypothetical protein
MFNKAFDEIDKAYIESLIEDEVTEAKHIDYKETLPGDTDREKNRFVEDVCAFANAAGGDIFFGLRDKRDKEGQKTGAPQYAGLLGLNLDQTKLRLEQIILNKVEPRISGVQFRSVEGFDGGPVLVMRIPRSYNAPHMTKHDGRFRSRTDSGNYVMDVQEIRSAFIASETLPERVRQFRAERLAKIVAEETPVPLHNVPKIVLHLVPVSSFAQNLTYDVTSARGGSVILRPMGDPSGNSRYNLDGLLSYSQGRGAGAALMYTQLYRDGRVEAVDALWIQATGEKKTLGRGFEKYIVDGMRPYLAIQEMLGVETPILAMLTFLGVRGYVIGGTDSLYARRGEDGIDRDDLIIGEVVIEEFGCAIEQCMRPAFDAVWMACGWPGSGNYDKNGNWKPPY